MAATRTLAKITIRVDVVTGITRDVEAVVQLQLAESGVTMGGTKVYAKDYDTMGPMAQARFDSIVADVNAFIQSQEPIS